jgi:hypothetical protein
METETSVLLTLHPPLPPLPSKPRPFPPPPLPPPRLPPPPPPPPPPLPPEETPSSPRRRLLLPTQPSVHSSARHHLYLRYYPRPAAPRPRPRPPWRMIP